MKVLDRQILSFYYEKLSERAEFSLFRAVILISPIPGPLITARICAGANTIPLLCIDAHFF